MQSLGKFCHLCCRVEDGDATAEDWTDSKGKSLRPDRFWNDGVESLIATEDEGPCMGIELNIWERAKAGIFDWFIAPMDIIVFISIVSIIYITFYRYCVIYCAHIGWLQRPAWGNQCP